MLRKQVDATLMDIRIREWVNLIAITGSAQVAVQFLGFISGILVIRLLPVHEYALYTLANTMLGTMISLADGGIATGVMAQSGKVWPNKAKMSAVLATGMVLRKKFAIFSLLVAIPILFYLLRKHEASWLMTVLIALLLIPAFLTSLSGHLLEIAPKLHQDIKPLQRYQVEANLGRLALLGLTMFVFPFAAVAIACAGVSQIWNNWRLRKAFAGFIDILQPVDPEARKAIVNVVNRAMPGVIYYSVSGQLSVWLLSIFGTGQNVAQIGALGRLSSVLTLVTVLFSTLVIPRFSRFAGRNRALLLKYLAIHASLIPIMLAVLLLVWIFPDVTLSILGADYSGIERELVLSITSALLASMAGITYAANASRGFILPPGFLIPVFTLMQISLILILPVGSLTGVLMLSIFTGLFSCAVLFLHGVYRILQLS